MDKEFVLGLPRARVSHHIFQLHCKEGCAAVLASHFWATLLAPPAVAAVLSLLSKCTKMLSFSQRFPSAPLAFLPLSLQIKCSTGVHFIVVYQMLSCDHWQDFYQGGNISDGYSCHHQLQICCRPWLGFSQPAVPFFMAKQCLASASHELDANHTYSLTRTQCK